MPSLRSASSAVLDVGADEASVVVVASVGAAAVAAEATVAAFAFAVIAAVAEQYVDVAGPVTEPANHHYPALTQLDIQEISETMTAFLALAE